MQNQLDGERAVSRGSRKWLRVGFPALLILLWVVGAGIGGPYFGKVGEVSSNDQTTYLPSSADATRVQQELRNFSDSSYLPAVLVFVGSEPLDEADFAALQQGVDSLAGLPRVGEGISPLLPSEDGLAAQVFLPISPGDGIVEAVDTISDHLVEHLPDGVRHYVTGPAGFTADLAGGFLGVDGLLLGVALLAVFLILIIVYRSLLLPVAVLCTSMFALTVALLTVWWLAKAEVVMLSGQTQGILFILVIGAATDYSLLYVSRYREELRSNQDKFQATHNAVRGAVEPIVASGGTVIAGLLLLMLSDLKSNSTLGPVASIGIVFAMLSALTLLPAILFLFGRAAFWPRRPHYEPEKVAAEGGMPTSGLWVRVGKLIRRHPRRVWLTTTVVLLIGTFGVTQLQASGVAQSDLVIGSSQARDGQVALGEHFPGGSGSPVYILSPDAALMSTAASVLAHPGVDAVSVLSQDSPSGSAPVTSEGIGPVGPPGSAIPTATVVDGHVMLQATLLDAADSAAAQQTVRELRAGFAAEGSEAIVGGVTATAIDTNEASIHDRTLIIPLILIAILLILMVLLRAVLAPVLLVATTVLSLGTALGVSAWLFNGVFNFPGADPAVPLYGFVFLVALGIDYNIFLVTRVREESLKHGTREGVIRGLAVTGGVITSAGMVLAATFAALAVIPILFLVQLAFIVAFGVLLDTFLVRALLVPALFYDLGDRVWWPSRLSRGGGAAARLPR